jgi:hypothetical protein
MFTCAYSTIIKKRIRIMLGKILEDRIATTTTNTNLFVSTDSIRSSSIPSIVASSRSSSSSSSSSSSRSLSSSSYSSYPLIYSDFSTVVLSPPIMIKADTISSSNRGRSNTFGLCDIRWVDHIIRMPMIKILQRERDLCHVYSYMDFFVKMFTNRYTQDSKECIHDKTAADMFVRAKQMSVDDFLVIFGLYKGMYCIPLDLLPYLTRECDTIFETVERTINNELDLCDYNQSILLHFVRYLRALILPHVFNGLRTIRILEHRDRFRAFYFSPKHTSYYEFYLAREHIDIYHKDKLLSDYINATKMENVEDTCCNEKRAIHVAQLSMLLHVIKELQEENALSVGHVLSLHYILNTLNTETTMHEWFHFIDYFYSNNIPLTYVGIKDCFERVYSICQSVLMRT